MIETIEIITDIVCMACMFCVVWFMWQDRKQSDEYFKNMEEKFDQEFGSANDS